MEAILLAVTVGALCIGCFVIGAKVGQQVARGETVHLEVPNPVEAVRAHKARKEADRERSKTEVILQNLERYDGTPGGQEDVPR